MINGYWGKIIVVDLTTGKIEIETPSEEIYKQYLGGVGLGARYLYDNMKPGVDSLGPENILGFLPGTFNGTGLAFSSRSFYVAKSPLTNVWGEASTGGYFGFRFKKAGYDGLFVKGASKEPVYLFIDEETIEIRDAKHLWGKSALETELILKGEFGEKDTGVSSIGVPGEKLALISCIMNDHGRAAARCGLGAVMGSKKLKSIVVKGNKKIPNVKNEAFRDLKRQVLEDAKGLQPKKSFDIMTKFMGPILPFFLRKGASGTAPLGNMIQLFKRLGTSMSAGAQSQMGDSPVKNWTGVGYKDFPMVSHGNKISDEQYEPFKIKKYACASCPIGCGAVLSLPESRYSLDSTHRPEYESIAAFGCNVLNNDLDAVLYANEICNSQGFDTISAGSVIAFAIECFENGLLTKEDTGGLELTFGNTEAIIKVLEQMVTREGIGDILADGSKWAAEKIGKNADQYAMHVHGQDLAMHDPRKFPGFASTYVTDPAPGRHSPGGTGVPETGVNLFLVEGENIPPIKKFEYKIKGKYQKLFSNYMTVLNSIGICAFQGWTGKEFPISALLNSLTGWSISPDEVLKIGERINNLRQVYNVREGIKPSDFQLPERPQGKPPLKDGPLKDITIDLDAMVESYFRYMDWDLESGKPSEAKLKELGLNKAIQDLY